MCICVMNGPFASNYIKPTLANTACNPAQTKTHTHAPTTDLIDHLFTLTFVIVICTFIINYVGLLPFTALPFPRLPFHFPPPYCPSYI